MVVSSYGSSTTSSGSVKLKKDMSIDPRDRDVLIIEDLIDTGNTLEWIVAHLRTKGCASVRLCCLLDKVERRKANVPVDYVGFQCPDGQTDDSRSQMQGVTIACAYWQSSCVCLRHPA